MHMEVNEVKSTSSYILSPGKLLLQFVTNTKCILFNKRLFIL